MGTTLDRSIEHLGSADAMIIRVRRKLLQTVRAHRDEGVIPTGVYEAAAYRRRGVQLILPRGENVFEVTDSMVRQVVPVA
jgi:hypothetical protein